MSKIKWAVLVVCAVGIMPALVTGISAQVVEANIVLSESDLELLRSDIRTKKMALMKENMDLADTEAEAFWKVYRNYESDMRDLWDKHLALIKDYAMHYEAVDEKKADQLATDSLKLEEDTVKLRRRYYNQMRKATSAVTAARFLQVDHRINTMVNAQLAQGIPLAE